MVYALVIGSVPVMHYRPKVGRSPWKVDAETGLLIQEAAQEALESGDSVTRSYRKAFSQIGVPCDKVQHVFWSWEALRTVAEPTRAQLQGDSFPAIFSFTEGDVVEQIHPGSVFRNAAHYVTTRDRKSVDQVRWGNLPF